ncbi:MAG TPA: hypothetical protein DCM05_01435 [Elusimicrobia bacterium]|nr:hypothetical protein [Elusimicrobiota bacterium]
MAEMRVYYAINPIALLAAAALLLASPAWANAVFPVTYLFLPGFDRAFWGVVVLEAFLWTRFLKLSWPKAAGLSLGLNLLSLLAGIPLALLGLTWLDSLPQIGLQSMGGGDPAPLLLRPLDALVRSLWIQGGSGTGAILWSLSVMTFVAAGVSIVVEGGALAASARLWGRDRKTPWLSALKVNLASYAVLWPAILWLGSYWAAHEGPWKTAMQYRGVFSIFKSLPF